MGSQSDVAIAAYKFEAVKVKLLQNKEGIMLSLVIHPNEVPQDLVRDWVGSRYMVAMAKLDDDDQPVIPKSVDEGKKARTSAVMLCKDEKFWTFVGMKVPSMAPVWNEEECAEGLKVILEIDSRSVIAKDKDVCRRFIELRNEFVGTTNVRR